MISIAFSWTRFATSPAPSLGSASAAGPVENKLGQAGPLASGSRSSTEGRVSTKSLRDAFSPLDFLKLCRMYRQLAVPI